MKRQLSNKTEIFLQAFMVMGFLVVTLLFSGSSLTENDSLQEPASIEIGYCFDGNALPAYSPTIPDITPTCTPSGVSINDIHSIQSYTEIEANRISSVEYVQGNAVFQNIKAMNYIGFWIKFQYSPQGDTLPHHS